MKCATCCNCAPSEDFGNWVARGDAWARAESRARASAMLIDNTLFAACASVTPLFRVSRLVSAFHRACAAAEVLKPERCKVCPGVKATGDVFAPAPSRTLPATETKVGNEDEFNFCVAT